MIWSWRYFQWWNITLSALCSCWEQVRCRFITVRFSKQTWTVLWQWPMAQVAQAKPLLFFRHFHFLEAKRIISTQGGRLDDPQSVKNISELLIDLFGGAKNTNIRRGASKPLGTVLTSANFTPTESARYRLVILIDGYHFWDQILTGHYDHTLEAI